MVTDRFNKSFESVGDRVVVGIVDNVVAFVVAIVVDDLAAANVADAANIVVCAVLRAVVNGD